MRLVFVLAALHCLAFIDRTMIGGVLPLVRDSVAMTDAQAGWIVGTAFALPYGVAALGALTAARAALGIGQGIFVPLAIARLVDGIDPDARSRALGVFTGGATAR